MGLCQVGYSGYTLAIFGIAGVYILRNLGKLSHLKTEKVL